MKPPESGQPLFVDFDLEISTTSVRIRSPLAGEARASFRNPFDERDQQALRAWLERAASTRAIGGGRPASIRLDDPQKVGEKLFQAVFNEQIYTLYNSSRLLARDRGNAGLRVRLNLLDESLESLPWELLYDPREDYLALLPDVSLVRYMDAPTPARPARVDGPLRVLMVAGDGDGLDLRTELDGVKKALTPLTEQGLLHLDELPRASIDDLFQAVSKTTYHIIHFLGHGEAPSADAPARLTFTAEGAPQEVPIDSVWRVLRRAESLRMIWLNSCSGAVGGGLTGPLASAAARLVSVGVSAVLANQLRISDTAAIRLARNFYENLARREGVDTALAKARLAVSISDLSSLEWATPVLYMRAPDGVLFEQPPAAAPTGAEPPATPPPVSPAVATSGSTSTGINFGSGNTIGNITIGDVAGRDIIKSYAPPTKTAPQGTDDNLVQGLREQLTILKRRLSILQQQQAMYGISSPPHVIMEIEDLEKQIKQLEGRIGGLSAQ
ncbi:MAG: CHAT domain-containing protein [Chloroflexaceae bacterium]|jgi:hypothetical protein|nr:CHAT domain-containing protein [Chloroflexaceae bacterium]